MYVKRILPNGVRLITERIDNMRTVSVGIWVGNGSRYYSRFCCLHHTGTDSADAMAGKLGLVNQIETRLLQRIKRRNSVQQML